MLQAVSVRIYLVCDNQDIEEEDNTNISKVGAG